MTIKERVRRTSVTIEFEQVYLNRKPQAFAGCETCSRENARLRLVDAVWLLRGVLTQLEATLDGQENTDICLFCLCSQILGSHNEYGHGQAIKAASK
jgi:hypothetical protein